MTQRRHGSPGRVRRHARAVHGSSLCPCSALRHLGLSWRCPRLLWPLLTSVRSRTQSLAYALSAPAPGHEPSVHNRRIYPAPGHHGLRHLVLTRPGAEPSMRFLFVGSHLCARASFGQVLAALPLPSASSYPDCIGSSHRGLSPHQFMPMSGVHKRLQPTRLRRAAEPRAGTTLAARRRAYNHG